VEVSANRLTYTFRLRRGVKFHNGREMTSDDVRASLDRWGRVNFRGRIVFANVDSLTNPDAATVVMKLKEPYALLLQDLGSFQSPAAVYPKDVVDRRRDRRSGGSSVPKYRYKRPSGFPTGISGSTALRYAAAPASGGTPVAKALTSARSSSSRCRIRPWIAARRRFNSPSRSQRSS
jgi:hypothetical protein